MTIPPVTSLTPTLAETTRRWRGPAAVAAALVLTALVLAVVASTGRTGLLDPDAADPAGSRALATLLRDQGVDVRPVRTLDDALAESGPGSTVLVTVPDLLAPARARALAVRGADLVLIGPDGPLGPYGGAGARLGGTAVAGPVGSALRDPGCDLPAAVRAGSVALTGVGYRGGDVRCYPDGPAAGLVVTGGAGSAGGRTVTVVGSADPFTNEHLDDDGSAALALGLLGADERLVWFRPSLADLGGGSRSVTDLLPGWVGPALAQLAVAAVLLAAWRARRLGPLVVEPLPVVVRAAETTEGRARLYRQGRSRDRAAEHLRAATGRRLAGRLGLPASEAVQVLAAGVAERTGRPSAEVTATLAGAAPRDDAGLVRLAADLDALEEEVLRP